MGGGATEHGCENLTHRRERTRRLRCGSGGGEGFILFRPLWGSNEVYVCGKEGTMIRRGVRNITVPGTVSSEGTGTNSPELNETLLRMEN